MQSILMIGFITPEYRNNNGMVTIKKINQILEINLVFIFFSNGFSDFFCRGLNIIVIQFGLN